jgi:hypothetical protein
LRKLARLAGLGAGASTLAVCLFMASAETSLAAQPGTHTAKARTFPVEVIQEDFGNGHWRVGAPTLAAGDAVIETADGRRVQLLPDGNNDGGVFIEFTAKTNLCVGIAANGVNVVIRDCEGGSGTVWFEEAGPSAVLFENMNTDKYLSGPDNDGQFQIRTRPAPSGWEQQMLLEPPN